MKKPDEKKRGIFSLPLEVYGKSVLGTELRYVPCKGKCDLLVIAGIHGEEPESTFLLSRSLRLLKGSLPKTAFVLCANPDGMMLGTRGNFNGVDLNRNFPVSVRPDEFVYSRSVLEAPRDTALRSCSGNSPEPEVKSLIELMERLQPKEILSIHAPIGCVDAPVKTPLVERLCETFNLSWVPDVGYPTPGSLGTWCKERSHNEFLTNCITLELQRMSLEALFERFGENFAELLQQHSL